MNLSGGRPDKVRAVVTEDGPGRESIWIPWAIHSLTSLYPGSEISGVPASDTKARFSPDWSLWIIFGTDECSLKSLREVNGFFEVQYNEENVNEVRLYLGDSINTDNVYVLENCPSGKKVSCSINLNDSEYNGKYVSYIFSISDVAGNTAYSRVKNIKMS